MSFKNRFYRVSFLVLSSLLISSGVAFSQAVDSVKIIQSIQNNLSPSNFIGTYEFVNTKTDGTTTAYVIRFESLDANHMRGFFEMPVREKGRELLRLGDNLWTWMPSVAKVVRIADRDSFAGGDFSNADVLRADWLDKYTPELIKDLPSQWIFDLKAKVPDAPYAKMRLWVDKKTTQPVQQHYYDSSGTLLKKCLYGSVQKFGSVERPSKLQMENVITKQKSELKIRDLKSNQKIPESRFVVDNLGK